MRVWLALVTVYVVWGSTFIALAITVRDLPPFLAMALRHLVAGGILLAIALPRGDTRGDRVGRPQIVAAFVFGGLLFVTGHGALAWAQQTVPAGVAALLVGTIPIWMALFDRLGFGHRLDVSAYFGIVLGFVGLAFLFDPFGEELDRQARCARDRPECDVLGGGVALLARSAAAEAPARLRRPRFDVWRPLLAGYATVSGELGEAVWTQEAVLALGYLIVVGSFVGFTAYVWLLRSAPTSLVSTTPT